VNWGKALVSWFTPSFTEGSIFSIITGWAINSAMVLIAATTFFSNKVTITDLSQAKQMLEPLLGRGAAVIFAIAYYSISANIFDLI